MRLAVATLQYGRHEHLERQAARVRELAGVDRYLVVSMDDAPPAPAGAEVIRLPAHAPDRLPLSAARNAAMAHLDDCDLVVLLDVDCIPDPGLVETYVQASRTVGRRQDRAARPGGLAQRRGPSHRPNRRRGGRAGQGDRQTLVPGLRDRARATSGVILVALVRRLAGGASGDRGL